MVAHAPKASEGMLLLLLLCGRHDCNHIAICPHKHAAMCGTLLASLRTTAVGLSLFCAEKLYLKEHGVRSTLPALSLH